MEIEFLTWVEGKERKHESHTQLLCFFFLLISPQGSTSWFVAHRVSLKRLVHFGFPAPLNIPVPFSDSTAITITISLINLKKMYSFDKLCHFAHNYTLVEWFDTIQIDRSQWLENIWSTRRHDLYKVFQTKAQEVHVHLFPQYFGDIKKLQ